MNLEKIVNAPKYMWKHFTFNVRENVKKNLTPGGLITLKTPPCYPYGEIKNTLCPTALSHHQSMQFIERFTLKS